MVARGLDSRNVRVKEVMSSPLVTIGEDATIEEAAKKMRENKMRRLLVERNSQMVGIISESNIVRVTPELHFLIRERSKLEAIFPSAGPRALTLAGFCEECGNYSSNLRNIDGRWLDENCMRT